MKLWVNIKEFDDRKSFTTKATVKDDKETFYYMPLTFTKASGEPTENCEINVKDSFFSCFKSKDGIKPKLVIMEYEFIRKSEPKEDIQESPKQENDPFQEFANEHKDEVELSDLDLPF